MTDPNTNCPSGWNKTRYSKSSCGRASTKRRSLTQSSSLSVEDHTVRCVVGSEHTSKGCQMPSMVIVMVERVQLTVPMSVVLLWCMAILDNTSGHLLVEDGRIIERRIHRPRCVHVFFVVRITISRHLLEKITFVSLDMYIQGMI